MAQKTSLLKWLMHRRSPLGLFWKSLRYDFNWRGRASVAEFWNFLLFFILICFAALGVVDVLQTYLNLPLAERHRDIVLMAVMLLLLPALLSVFIRRLHDTGRFAVQGFILMVIPFVGGLILLYLMVRPGLDYTTRFGVEPRNDGL